MVSACLPMENVPPPEATMSPGYRPICTGNNVSIESIEEQTVADVGMTIIYKNDAASSPVLPVLWVAEPIKDR